VKDVLSGTSSKPSQIPREGGLTKGRGRAEGGSKGKDGHECSGNVANHVHVKDRETQEQGERHVWIEKKTGGKKPMIHLPRLTDGGAADRKSLKSRRIFYY